MKRDYFCDNDVCDSLTGIRMHLITYKWSSFLGVNDEKSHY